MDGQRIQRFQALCVCPSSSLSLSRNELKPLRFLSLKGDLHFSNCDFLSFQIVVFVFFIFWIHFCSAKWELLTGFGLDPKRYFFGLVIFINLLLFFWFRWWNGAQEDQRVWFEEIVEGAFQEALWLRIADQIRSGLY